MKEKKQQQKKKKKKKKKKHIQIFSPKSQFYKLSVIPSKLLITLLEASLLPPC